MRLFVNGFPGNNVVHVPTYKKVIAIFLLSLNEFLYLLPEIFIILYSLTSMY